MTEATAAPKVVALNVTQWKAVVLSDLATLHQALANIQAPSDVDIANIDQFVANTRNMLHGWKVAGAQAAALAAAQTQQVNVTAEERTEPVQVTNGTTPPKGKGGWPKGKKRNAPAQAATQ